MLIDRTDLVGQRVDRTAAHRHIGVEEIGQPDSLGLAHQPELVAVALKAPLAATGDNLQLGLSFPEQDLGIDRALPVPIHHLGSLAHHLGRDDPYCFAAH